MRTKKEMNVVIRRIILEGTVSVTSFESMANSIIESLNTEGNLIIPVVKKSFTPEQVANELKDCETIDDAIMLFGNMNQN